MKRCPECNRLYRDQTLNFCLDDGSSLVYGLSAEHTDQTFPYEPPTRRLADPTSTPRTSDEAIQRTHPEDAWKRKGLLAAGLIVSLILVSVITYRSISEIKKGRIESLAVMPFTNDSGDPDVDYLADGMTETLIDSLSKIPDLNVKARSSVFRYKGKDADAHAVGAQLGVEALLNGRMAKHGDNLTLYIELVDPQTGNRTWGTQYERKISDLLSLQGEIAQDVSEKLKAKLSGDEQKRLVKNYTTNVEAYQLYLRGRYHLFKLTPAEIQTGISYFQQAIDIDPSYALAYVGLAHANRALVLSTDMPAKVYFPNAKAAAQRAVSIDDSLAEAHAVLGFTIFWYDWDWATSEKEFRRAIELDPNSADAHWGYSHLLSNIGRHDEALAEAKIARELDPLNLIISGSEGLYLIDAGQPDAGLARLQKTLELEPNYWFAHLHAASAYCDKRMYDDAVAEARKSKDANRGSTMPVAFLGYALARSGRAAEAREVLDGLLKPPPGSYVPPYHIAMIYNGLGDRTAALEWLERGVRERDPKMTFLKVDKKWDNLRADAAFQNVLKQVGFPD